MSETNTFKIQETEDGDLFFDLPDELLEAMDWKEDDIVNVEVVGDRIVLSKAPRGEGGAEVAGGVSEQG